MRILGGAAILFAVLMLGAAAPPASAGAPPIPGLVFPFPEGQTWRITCGYADGAGCQHADTQYVRYALDFQRVPANETAGQPVRAAAGGTVAFAGWGGADSYGWYVQIAHADGYSTLYAHMIEQPAVAAGQHVEQGEEIGSAGCTGRCTGPHIHFALMLDGATVLPEPICGETGFDDGQTHANCQPQTLIAAPGDATCDGRANSIDAAIVLQFSAALIQLFPCIDAADVNWDGRVDPVDASLIIQYDARSISTLLRGSWSAGAPMPTPRTEVTSAAVGSVIYVIGGYRAVGGNTGLVEAYDIATDTWTTTAPLPARIDHAAAAAVGGIVYVAGGYTGGGASAALYAYDPLTDEWASRATMPFARAAAATVALDGSLYVFGGIGTQPAVPLRYDPGTNSWTKLAPMSAPREHLTAAVVDSKVYVIGGRENSVENVDTVEVYDPVTNAWQTLAGLPTPRGGLASGVLGGLIHLVGGEDLSPGGTTFEEHEVYNPATDGWRLAPPLPTSRHGLTAQVVSGKLYVIGGGPSPNLSVSDAVEVYELP